MSVVSASVSERFVEPFTDVYGLREEYAAEREAELRLQRTRSDETDAQREEREEHERMERLIDAVLHDWHKEKARTAEAERETAEVSARIATQRERRDAVQRGVAAQAEEDERRIKAVEDELCGLHSHTERLC